MQLVTGGKDNIAFSAFSGSTVKNWVTVLET